jgi:hypothetical protein
MFKAKISIFVILTIIAFELPKLPYLLMALYTNEYKPIPYFANALGIGIINVNPFALLYFWIISNVNVLMTLHMYENPYIANIKTYKYLHLALFAFHAVFYHRTPLIINATFVLNTFYTFASLYVGVYYDEYKNNSFIRNFIYIYFTMPVLINIFAFVHYCLIMEQVPFAILYVYLNYFLMHT